MKHIKKTQGFTLIELLIVIGILAVLLAITIIAINPAKQFAKANNAARLAAVNTILNAVGQCYAENKGTFSGSIACDAVNQLNTVSTYAIAAGATTMTTTGTGAVTAASPYQVNLCGLVSQGYVAALPKDPTAGTGASSVDTTVCGTSAAPSNPTSVYNTGFTISKNASNKVTIQATPDYSDTSYVSPALISVTR